MGAVKSGFAAEGGCCYLGAEDRAGFYAWTTGHVLFVWLRDDVLRSGFMSSLLRLRF